MAVEISMANKDFSGKEITDKLKGNFSYQQLKFSDFIAQYQYSVPSPQLYELSLPWLIATYEHMLQHGSINNSASLLVHCLFTQKIEQASSSDLTLDTKPAQLLIAWPIVHESGRLRSLTSFYSAVTEPLFISGEPEFNLALLLRFIEQKNNWHQMLLGAVDHNSVISKCLVKHFSVQKIISQTENFYLDGLSCPASSVEQLALISNFDGYYQQRPSQLRNTIKRRGKKLAQTHHLDIKIITTLADFSAAFTAYKDIYQQSWKGDEFSFAFIEQVCRVAISEDKLRLGLLLVDGEPAAAQLWFLQGGNNSQGIEYKNASIFKLAYAPKYQHFSVGSVLSKALSEHVLNKDNVTSIEFGMGSEPYKKDWLPKKRLRVCYQIFNQRTLYGKLLAWRYVYLPKVMQRLRSSILNVRVSK